MLSPTFGWAYEFALGGVPLELQEVTTNLDVYFSAMRWNRISNEWDVDVTISNKSAFAISAPLFVLADSFKGTTGLLRPDGISTNKAFYDFSGQIPNGVLGPTQISVARTLGIAFVTGQSPQVVTRLFAGTNTNGVQALAFARSLNEVGQPIAGVNILETGPAGSSTNMTDAAFGVATLGQSPGTYTWKFSQNGYLPVWRQALLQSNFVTVVPYPWLTQRDPQTFNLSPLLGGTASNQTETIQFSPGSEPQNTIAQLTALSGQTLPFFLPQGWSPLQAFWLELGAEPTQPAIATLVPWGPITNSENAALVQFVPGTLNWQVLQTVAGNGTNALSVLIPGSGAYALVVPDSLPVAPPSAVVGAALQAASGPAVDSANLRASGTVTPANSPASLMPESVTASADLVVSNMAGSLSSGTLLRGEVSERSLLNDGTSRVPPLFDSFIVGYQRPGQAQTGIVHAQFPMRPVLLFGPDQLNQGVVHMDIFPPGLFTGGVLDTNGGLIASDGLRLLAGPGVLASQQAVELRRLSPTNFTDLAGTNFSAVAAFEAAMAALPAGHELFLQSTGVPPNMTFVLARVLTQQGLYGLEPRARLHSDINGNLTSDEPAAGDRLPGLNGAGQYVLLQVQPQQGLVEGIAQNSTGQPTGGLPVRITGQPWLTFSAPDGGFKLLAPAGAGNLAVNNPATGDSGNQAITVPANLAPVNTSVGLGISGLRVASITPADTATNVPQVSSVVITFNRPINPATVLSNAVQLIGTSNQPVATSFSLNLANTTATLLPNSPLDPATQFAVLLSTNITDSIGRPLQAQTQFSFTTVVLSARDPAAQLIIYEPGATNIDTNVVADLPGYVPGTKGSQVVVHGTPGSADPGVPVIIVNEGTGETGTVLSKQDGSFTSLVAGQEQDFISATFVSLNGARVYVPVNRQLFDDGTVGLYAQGGALQAQGSGGGVKITVPPNALTGRSKFKLASVDVPGLETQLGGILPSDGVVAGSALNLNIQGPLPTLPVQVSFPVDLSQLNYPTNESGTNAAAALAIVQTNQNVTAFQVVDQLFFHPSSNGEQVKHMGVKGDARRPKGAGNPGAAVGALDTSLGLLISSLGPAGYLAQVGFNQVLVPMLFGPRPVTIKGGVGAVPYDISYQLQIAGLANQIYNLQLGSLSGNQILDVPLGLVQQMGFKYVPQNILQPISGTAGNIVGGFLALTLQALKLKEADLATPLSGAFITVTLVGGGLNRVPGHLYPGMIYATSGANGSFLTVAPAAGFNYVVTCTHPLYQEALTEPVAPINALPGQQGQLGLAGAVFQNFFFQLAATNQILPSVSIANTPVRPAPGQTSQIIVNASQPSGTPTVGVHIFNVGTNNLETGQVVTNVHYNLANVATIPGPNNSVQWIGTLTADKPVDIALKIDVIGQAVNQYATYPYHIAFTGPIPPTSISNIPPPGTNDVHGPLVAAIDPVYDGFIAENSSITVYFNKPIDPLVTNHLQGITLTPQGGGPGNVPAPIVQLSPSQTIMILKYPGLSPGTSYQLSLSGLSIVDLAGKPLDQLPSTASADSFTTVFRTRPQATANLPGMVNGRGCAISGNALYVIDQAPQDNYLLVYDITSPLKPKLLSRTHLFGLPRDLVVVPQFRYLLDIHDQTIKTNDLVVVVGGDLDAVISDPMATSSGTTVSTRGQYLWVLSMADPAAPQILASPIVSYRIGSAVCKVRWAPPYVVYQEFGADIQQLGLVNLQELIIGFNSTPAERAAFPDPAHRNAQNSGYDSNGDGDYVDAGESLPIPDQLPAEFYGKHQSYVLQGSTQKILDFSVTPGGRTVGVSLSLGVTLDENGNPLGPPLTPMYRTLVSGGLPLTIGVTTNAMLPFGRTAYPRWVSILEGAAVQINNSITTLNLALVALTPETNGLQELAVIDISQPLNPRLLNEIPVDTSLLGGSMESLTRRGDGLLELAGDQNVVLLNPLNLAITNFPAGQAHPAILETIVGAGTGTRSVGQGDGGIYAVANGARGVIVETPPQLRFVSFPTNGALVDPSALHRFSESGVLQMLAGMVPASDGLAPARVQAQPTLFINSDLEPIPNPALHFHVLVSAPGGPVAGGNSIEVGLESLNPVGRPFSNLGHGFAPVRAISDLTQTAINQIPRANCGAPIRSITAYRLSDNPKSILYNLYLSKPFALITEAVSLDDLSRLKIDGGVDREIIFSGAGLRAFLDPNQPADAIITPFVAQVDTGRKTLFPIAAAFSFTVNRDYIVGNNPPPAAGSSPLEDTFGTIQAHSGELRAPDVDMVLPSPHMQITIVRIIGNQDNYEGPFGVGWDFNYNQRLTVLDPLTFPVGLQMPLVVRDNPADSEIAGSQDVLFNNGEGQVFHFRWVDTNMPPEYAQDPLVQQFDYKDLVSDYYLPEHGSFDLFVKYKDQRFERLTPDGMRFRYSPQGRLEMIIDRFPQNHHDLQYDHNNGLVRIDDYSVSSPRYVRFGHFRRQATDQDFDTDVDINTDNTALEGKICRLLDYAGRDIFYQYSDDGFLTNRMGVLVAGENGGYAGRSHTYYTYKDCGLSGILVTEKGSPLISSVSSPGPSGKPVTTSTTGSHGTDKVSVPLNNSAQTLAQQATSVTMGDGSTIERHFDAMGYVTSAKVTGAGGATASEITSNTVDGLPYYVLHPEGNSETTTYDTGNIIFRSRANVKKITVNPGPRGGQGYAETFQYDSRCNLPSGDHVNPDGFHVTYALNTDGTAVQSITYGNAGTRTFTYNNNGQLTDKLDENGVESSIGYDSSTGFVTSQTRGGLGGIKVTYSYDGSVASQLGKASSIAQALGQPTILHYNSLLQPVEVDRGAYVTTTAFDELGRGIQHQEQVGDNEQWVSSLQYNNLGFLTNATMSGIEVNGQLSSVTYNYEPDSRMRVATIYYSNGATQTFNYDERGNRISSTIGNYIEEFTYDLNNNQTGLKQGSDLIAAWNYNGLDRPTNVTYFTGSQTYNFDSSYFNGGALHSSSVTDPVYGVIQLETVDQIDEFGRAVIVTQHGTTISPQFQYQHGLLTSSVVGPRMTATTTWDSAGNRTGASTPFLSLSIKRDDNARVLQTDEVEDGTKFTHFYSYDVLDHQTGLSDLAGQMFSYNPRPDGNEDSITDGRGNATILSHTALGEVLQRQRADGMTTVYRHDTERRVVYEGDPGAGFDFGFDDTFRLTNSTLRSGASIAYGQFDKRRMPQTVNLPGAGSETVTYDFLTRVLQRKVSYQSTAWEEDYSYDALDRERVETYIQNGGANNTTTYDYDLAGPLLAADYHEDSVDFAVTNTYYSDASRQSVIYPSGVTVNEARDTSTRLTGISDANGNILSATAWQGTFLPTHVQIGTTMLLFNQYDQRGRLTGSRVTRRSDGAVLAHMRYEYDAANNLTARQFVHREGRADVFGIDNGERLVQERVGVIPTNAAATGPLLYQRNYSYHNTGLDYLTQARLAGPWDSPPPFATNWSGHDQFLVPGFVNGANRTSDPMGNVATAQLWVRPVGAAGPQAVSATLQYDGMRHLVNVTRVDGVSIVNQYQPSGLRFSRKVFQGAQLVSYSAFVYDDAARLIEEYDRKSGAQPVLIARYYYASGDSPVAADLFDQTTQALKRYYLIRDVSQSVIAIADDTGTVVERVWYDAFGQPQIEESDTAGATLQSVIAGTNNVLLAVLSEPVLAPLTDPGLGAGIVPVPALEMSNLLTFVAGSSNLVGTTVLLPAYPGFPPYSVLQFTPSQPLAQPIQVSVSLAPNLAADEWGNLNQQATALFQVTTNLAGTVYYTATPAPHTAPTVLARSGVGCSFLFHGQYYDYDSGLIYLRSRFYDPFSGMFFQPDPLGYEQSVNHYAAFNNNPASVRDPTGLQGSGRQRTVVREGSQGREKYDEIALHVPGVDRQVLDARNSKNGEQLVHEGMGDHSQTALIAAVRELFPPTGDNTVEIALKHQTNPVFARYFVNEGWQQKAEWIINKSKLGKILTRKGRYAPDVDGLYIKVNNVLLDYHQTKAVCDRANEISMNLAGTFERAGIAGIKGYAKMWQKASNMFKHGFTANLMEEIGLPHYHGEGELRGKAWLEQELQAKVKKIPDGFSITLKGNYSDFTLDSVKNVSSEDVASVFKEKLQIFHDKLDPKNVNHPDEQRRFDESLYNRVMSELYKGDFDIDHFPIGNGQIGLQ